MASNQREKGCKSTLNPKSVDKKNTEGGGDLMVYVKLVGDVNSETGREGGDCNRPHKNCHSGQVKKRCSNELKNEAREGRGCWSVEKLRPIRTHRGKRNQTSQFVLRSFYSNHVPKHGGGESQGLTSFA